MRAKCKKINFHCLGKGRFIIDREAELVALATPNTAPGAYASNYALDDYTCKRPWEIVQLLIYFEAFSN